MYVEKGKNGRKIYVWLFVYCADVFRIQGFVGIQKYHFFFFFCMRNNHNIIFFDSVGSSHYDYSVFYITTSGSPDKDFQIIQRIYLL